MPTEPLIRLHPRFTHLVRGPGFFVLVGERETRTLDAPLGRAVVPELDGTRTASEIVTRLAGDHPAAHVHYLILRLRDEGLVVPAAHDEAPDTGGAAFGALRGAWDEVRDRGARLLPPGRTGALPDRWILLCADVLDPRLDGYLAEGDRAEPVVLVRPGSDSLWVGPVLGPEGACLECLRARLRLNLTARGLLHRRDPGGEVEVVPLPAGPPPESLGLLSTPLAAPGPDELRVVRGDGVEEHPVRRLPTCARCGDPTRTVPGAELRLRPVEAQDVGGSFRIRPAEETLDAFGHLLSPLTGIVRHVRRLPTPGAPEIHVFTAGHAHHHGLGTLRALRDDLRDHSGGKGRTEVEARTSAFCESLERFSGVHRGNEPVVRARSSCLEGTVVRPRDLLGFSPDQYAARKDWNAGLANGFHYVPEPYRDQEIGWARVRAPFADEEAWVPAAALYAGTPDPGARFIGADSNGLAGGNCLEEAVLQGLLEVVERDAVAIWWYNQVRRPGIDLRAPGDPWLARMAAVHRRLGRSLHALDLTHDVGVPVAAAISARSGEGAREIVFGFGAHVDPRIALGRAVSEANQMLPAVLQDPATRRRRLLPEFGDALKWWEEASLEDHDWLTPDPGAEPVETPPAGPSSELCGCIRDILDRLGSLGLRAWLHDLTRADVGFPTVRVLVPGLRHFWRRLGPGRLYDVPVALGWRDRPLPEDRMNPISIFV